MQVKCTLCDKIEELDDNTLKAKRLKNRRTYMHLCEVCYDRIDKNTRARHATGKFRLYEEKKLHDPYI